MEGCLYLEGFVIVLVFFYCLCLRSSFLKCIVTIKSEKKYVL